MTDLYDLLLAQKLSAGGGGGGGGGDISIKRIFNKQYAVEETTSTTTVKLETVTLPEGWDDGDLLVFTSDYVGTVPRNHHAGNRCASIVLHNGGGSSKEVKTQTIGKSIFNTSANNIESRSAAAYGVYITSPASSQTVDIKVTYNGTYTTRLGGTYDCSIYSVKLPQLELG